MQRLGVLNNSDNFSRASSVSNNGSVIVGNSAYNGFRYHGTTMTDLGQSHDIVVSEDSNTVIGNRNFNAGSSFTEHLVKFNGSEVTDLGTLGGIGMKPTFVSADGSTILGWGYVNGASDTHAFEYSAGHLVDLGDHSHFWPYAASHDGTVRIGHLNGMPLRAVADQMQTLGMIGL